MCEVDRRLVLDDPDGVGPDIAGMVAAADMFLGAVDEARRALVTWRQALFALFDRVELLALPTLPIFPPRIDEVGPDNLLPIVIEITRHVALFNAAGTPCTRATGSDRRPAAHEPAAGGTARRGGAAADHRRAGRDRRALISVRVVGIVRAWRSSR